MFLLTQRDIEARLLDPEVKKLYGALITTTNGVTAATGSTQATGVPITTAITRVTTVGTIGDSVTLPKAVAGMSLVVINASATSMDVFPAVGDAINGGAADAALAVAGAKSVLLVCAVAGIWNAIVTA